MPGGTGASDTAAGVPGTPSDITRTCEVVFPASFSGTCNIIRPALAASRCAGCPSKVATLAVPKLCPTRVAREPATSGPGCSVAEFCTLVTAGNASPTGKVTGNVRLPAIGPASMITVPVYVPGGTNSGWASMRNVWAVKPEAGDTVSHLGPSGITTVAVQGISPLPVL